MAGNDGWFAHPGRYPGPAAAAEAVPRPEFADVGRLLRRGVRSVVRAARSQEQRSRTELRGLVHHHLGTGPHDAVPVVVETWPGYDTVNVQAGLDAWLAEPGREHRLIGVVGYQHRGDVGLAELMAQEERFGLSAGNVARVNLPSGPDGETLPCLRCAVLLVTDAGGRAALLVRGPENDGSRGETSVQIAAVDEDRANDAAAAIRTASLRHNVFRGQVVTFGGEMFGHHSAALTIHPRPVLEAGQVILPTAVLGAVERQIRDVARHKERLLAAGQHLKRGLLLYGPPGVGKTHTVRYLTASLPEATVVQLTGGALHYIEAACSVARALQPSMVVVEDVDLIAEDRGEYPGQHPLLFQLLNEMDGLREDADVVFVLTTNRADLLEPALAARPGRVDQAVELTLPDAEARRRLVELYRGGVDLDTSRLDDVVARTDGVTASFLKELLRRAALLAVVRQDDADVPLSVSADDLDAALDELLDTRNAMTRVLIGGARDD